MLRYYETKYGYPTELIYYFENGNLDMVSFDFFPNRNSYHTWSELETIHVCFATKKYIVLQLQLHNVAT
ncbi:hypothetical protein MHH70_17245 [Metasolibacillus sp. FSL H7-0170]|uniref:hypothetical protein n=1 Tax=Metasolibacillus sp. FSL H7-0170 TaxID=2921431 RepID=UPI0031593A5A